MDDTRLDLLSFVEQCGSLSEAAMQLKIPAIRIGDAVLGLGPMPPRLLQMGIAGRAAAVDGAREGRQVLASYMKLRGFSTAEEAADSLEVTTAYLLQQTGMAYPTGAVVNTMRRQIEQAHHREVVPEEQRLAAQKRLAEALTRQAAARAETVEQHNARVLAERKARKP